MVYYLSSKHYKIILLVLVCIGCSDKPRLEATEEKPKQELIMYQPSEMANLMKVMYAYNLQLKEQIKEGKQPVSMPLDLMKLHSAEMSNGHSRTTTWNSFVNVFIESQHMIADTLSNTNLKERYNNAINNCLACHKTECTGPIPKIKKLLIE
jgi:hypothetical protein